MIKTSFRKLKFLILVVHDLDTEFCNISCCPTKTGGCTEGSFTCGGELGRVTIFNLVAVPVTIGLNVYLTNEANKNVAMEYTSTSSPPVVAPPTTTTTPTPTTASTNTTTTPPPPAGLSTTTTTTTTASSGSGSSGSSGSAASSTFYKSVTGADVPTTVFQRLNILEVSLDFYI